MDDRALLEAAAKAAGIEIEREIFHPAWGLVIKDRSLYWNPIHNDGDALRLAVQLRLIVEAGANRAIVSHPGFDAGVWYEHSDPYAATRRAIVRAAAEIGRTMT